MSFSQPAENKNKDKDKDNVSVTLSLELFKCPARKQLFRKPVSAVPCGHYIEQGDKICPCCNAGVNTTKQPDLFFKDLFAAMRNQHPAIDKEQKEKASVSVSLPIQLFTCPISGQIFHDPVVVGPCGHFFEYEQIYAYQKNQCPCCRGARQATTGPNNFFKKVFEEVLKQNHPWLANERYFSQRAFLAAYELLEPASLFQMLAMPSEKLNAPMTEGRFVGVAPIFCLALLKKGKEYLLQEPIVSLLNADSLQCTFQNVPVAHALLQNHGITFFEELAKIRELALLMFRVLNSGSLPLLYLLSRDPLGSLLLQRHNLLDIVSKEALNKVYEDGTSALYYLAKNLQYGLLQNQHLCGLMTAEALNTVVKSGLAKGETPLLWLTFTEYGCRLLENNQVASLITSQGLNAMGDERGCSPLSQLFAYGNLQLFYKNNQLVDKITAQGLNTISTKSTKNILGTTSALFFLVHTPQGKKFLAEMKQIPGLITKEALNTPVKSTCESLKYCPYEDETALLCMTADAKTINLLRHNKELRDKINEVGMNTADKAYQNSPVTLLMQSSEGRQLLLTDNRLLALITPETFHRKNCKGKSPFDYLKDSGEFETWSQLPGWQRLIKPATVVSSGLKLSR